MCGITGYIANNKYSNEKMLKALNHRGPNDHGIFVDICENKQVFLGQTRLSIIDLSQNGHQPMLSEDQNIVLIFNGEIYNFQTLKETHLKDQNFKSKSDTEVILKLYQKFGIDFLSLINGDFAISIFDKKHNKLFLIRDRVGVKPLYYYYKDNELIFASEIKSISESGIKLSLNEDQILPYFVFKYSPGEATLFQNIKRVKPGTYLEYDFQSGKISSTTYWSLNKNDKYKNYSYSDFKTDLENLIEDSIKIRLISDVPIGNFLSGGLDSSIIAYYLKNNKSISHYCASKNEEDLKKEGTTSDYYYADKLAKEWGLKLNITNIGVNVSTQELIRQTNYYSDDLIADGSQIPSYLISKEVTKESKVILSGMGADELFLGYAGHALTLYHSEVFSRIPSLLKKSINFISKNINQGKGAFLAYRRYIHKSGKYLNYGPAKYAILNIVGDFENSCSIINQSNKPILELFDKYFPKNQSIFDSLFQFELENFLVKNLHYTDRMTMAHGVECRVPFLDYRIVELAYNIPTKYKLTYGGTFKKILKDIYAQKLPNYITKRRKAGFGMPLRSIFSNKKNITNLLNIEEIKKLSIFNISEINRCIENHLSGKEDNSAIIYALISFQEWYKLHINTNN